MKVWERSIFPRRANSARLKKSKEYYHLKNSVVYCSIATAIYSLAPLNMYSCIVERATGEYNHTFSWTNIATNASWKRLGLLILEHFWSIVMNSSPNGQIFASVYHWATKIDINECSAAHCGFLFKLKTQKSSVSF